MSRLLDPKRDGKWPFEYRSAAQTDVGESLEAFDEESGVQAMTHREDNQLLDQVQAWLDAQEDAKRTVDDCIALLAFAFLCLMIFVALHVGVVLP